jgi:hypothetical protein
MLTNVTVTTTVTLMIPVQTATVDEPHDSLERDLIARSDPAQARGDKVRSPRNTRDTLNPNDIGNIGQTSDNADVHGQSAALSRCVNLLATTDDFGQPTADPNPMIEPSWQQICAMGYEIPGIGVIGGDIVASILEKFDTRIARILLDERTGVVIETSIDQYLPNPSMRRFIQKRDTYCRFPGCARNAKRCEPDHVIPHSRGGPTAIWNLVSLCKHHHRVKHDASWKLAMTPDGECTWTDPHGQQYATHPINHHELAA